MNLVAVTSNNWLFVADSNCRLLGFPLHAFDEKETLESELTLNYITREQSDVTEMAQLDMSINFVYSGLHNGTEIIGCVDDGGNVVLWKANGDQTAIFLQNNDRISTWGLATSNCHSYVAASANNHCIRFWNTTCIQDSFTLSGHQHNIPCISFVASGEFLVSASIDGTIRIWDVFKERKCLKKIKVPEEEWGWTCLLIEKQAIFEAKHPNHSSSSTSSSSSVSDEGWEVPAHASLSEGLFVSLLADNNAPNEDRLFSIDEEYESPFSDEGDSFSSNSGQSEGGQNTSHSIRSDATFLSFPISQRESEVISGGLSVYDEIFESSGPTESSNDEYEEFGFDVESAANAASPFASLNDLLLIGTNNYGLFGYDFVAKTLIFNKYNIVMRNLNSRQRVFFGPIALRYVNRLNMNLWIPHVSCLVTASQCGFVVVSRLERVNHAFRLIPTDVLPKTQPPLCPLAGLAYVPVPDNQMHLCTSVQLLLVYTNGTVHTSLISNQIDKFLFI